MMMKLLKHKNSGLMTIYFSFVFIAIFLVLLVLIERTKLYVCENNIKCAVNNASLSILSFYNKEFFNELGIYAISSNDIDYINNCFIEIVNKNLLLYTQNDYDSEFIERLFNSNILEEAAQKHYLFNLNKTFDIKLENFSIQVTEPLNDLSVFNKLLSSFEKNNKQANNNLTYIKFLNLLKLSTHNEITKIQQKEVDNILSIITEDINKKYSTHLSSCELFTGFEIHCEFSVKNLFSNFSLTKNTVAKNNRYKISLKLKKEF